jgi:hypothetical protein
VRFGVRTVSNPEAPRARETMSAVSARACERSTRLRQTALVSAPESRYAETSSGRIGYQAVREGLRT